MKDVREYIRKKLGIPCYIDENCAWFEVTVKGKIFIIKKRKRFMRFYLNRTLKNYRKIYR